MKKITYTILVLFVPCLSVLQAAPAGSSGILPPQKRTVTVDLAKRLAKEADAAEVQIAEDLRSPFIPSAEVQIDTKAVRPTSDKDLLAALADQLHPAGVMGREDALILLLKGQKGVKLNDKLTLSFDGAVYDVEVIAINRSSFSLRYNQAEITRPIK